MCSNHTDTYSRVAPSRDIFARKKTEYNYHLVYKPNMPNPSVTPPVTKRQSVRMKRQESSDLSERQCSKIKCEFYRVFQTVNQFEESMAQSLTRAERNEVSNLVLPALNTLTGISGYRNGNSMMPAQPRTCRLISTFGLKRCTRLGFRSGNYGENIQIFRQKGFLNGSDATVNKMPNSNAFVTLKTKLDRRPHY